MDLGLEGWLLVVTTRRCDAVDLALGSGLGSDAADPASFAADREKALGGSLVVEYGQRH